MIELSQRQRELKNAMKKLLLGDDETIPFEALDEKTHGLAALLFPELENREVAEVVALLTAEHEVTLKLGGSIVDPKTFEEWLESKKAVTDTPRWDAYAQLLISRGWAVNVINSLATLTDEIVELLGDPSRPGPWRRRGLLMGEVQSGKTATYLGILNKALDYGYRLVIVIGGHTNELRRQTQSRADSDLIGFKSEFLGDNISVKKTPRSGIGRINPDLAANVLTTVHEDFSGRSSRAGYYRVNQETPTVLVIKKNVRLIENVSAYLSMQASGGALNVPMVVIDDESDWGTPNTGSDTDPTRVNKAIRNLLSVSTKSSYVAITATPFANIFIDDEATYTDRNGTAGIAEVPDLFPSDYIRVMSSPSNYLGIDQYFGAHPESQVITDVEDCIELLPIKHKKDHPLTQLPNSLRKALVQFLIGTAIRRIRFPDVTPASMLVNISRFNDVQKRAELLVRAYMDQLLGTIQTEFARDSRRQSDLASEVAAVWESDFSDVSDTSWAQIKAKLFEIHSEFKVELVNGQTVSRRQRERRLLTSEQRLAEDLRPTVYVGGDVLARGLTLEGLQVSYFVREPRTMDTLMQMGRWFGYRPGFEDLVKIWIPERTRDDFSYSAEVTAELRELILEMRARNLTPRDFGLRVRTNPESVAIIASNKAKNAKQVDIGPIVFENHTRSCIELSANDERQSKNRKAVEDLIREIGASPENRRSSKCWDRVPVEVIRRFLGRFRGYDLNPFWGGERVPMPAIADALNYTKGGDFWRVAIIEADGKPAKLTENLVVKQVVRNKMGRDGDLIKLGNNRLGSPGDLKKALREEEIPLVERLTSESGKGFDSVAYGVIENPILLIYPLSCPEPQPAEGRESVILNPETPLISVAIAFPKLGPEEAQDAARKAKRYMVNTVWVRNSMGYVDDGDDREPDEID